MVNSLFISNFKMKKKILYKTLLFAIPILAFILFFEIYIRMRPSVYQAKRDNLVANADSIRVLIVGDSQTTYGINPNLFNEFAYNLAFEAQPIYFDRKLLEKYLPDLPNLKYVFLGINYHNLLFYEHSEERDFFYKYYYDIPYNNSCYLKEYCLRSVFAHKFKETWFLYWFDRKNKGIIYTTDKKGWISRPASDYNSITSILQARINTEPTNKDFSVIRKDSIILKDLEAAIVLLKQKNVIPVLITCPIYKVCRDLINPLIKSEMEKIAHSLAEKYDILYLDYYEDDSFEISDYFDAGHLNNSGAEKLTLRLDSIINNAYE